MIYNQGRYPSFWRAVLMLVVLRIGYWIAGIIMALMLGVFVGITGLYHISSLPVILLLGSLLVTGLISYFGVLYAKRRTGMSWGRMFGERIRDRRVYAWVVMVVIGMNFFNRTLIMAFHLRTPGGFEQAVPYSQPILLALFNILTTCLMIPAVEEMLFRGVIFRGFLQCYQRKWAIVLSALLFAIQHGNLGQGVVAFVMGIFLGWIYFKTRSLTMAIFAHGVYNAFEILVMPFYIALIRQDMVFGLTVLFFGGCLFILIGYRYLRRLSGEEAGFRRFDENRSQNLLRGMQFRRATNEDLHKLARFEWEMRERAAGRTVAQVSVDALMSPGVMASLQMRTELQMVAESAVTEHVALDQFAPEKVTVSLDGAASEVMGAVNETGAEPLGDENTVTCPVEVTNEPESEPASSPEEAFLQQRWKGLHDGLCGGEWEYWIAEKSGLIVAQAFLQRIQKTPFVTDGVKRYGVISNLYTLPELRGYGIGSTLVSRMKIWAKEEGLDSLDLGWQ